MAYNRLKIPKSVNPMPRKDRQRIEKVIQKLKEENNKREQKK